MGLNILLYRVTPGQRYGEQINPWTASHHGGDDRDFEAYCLRENIDGRDDPEYQGWGDVPIIYWRPRDLALAEQWVRQRMADHDNESDFLEVLALMRADTALYFYSSW